MQHSSDLAIVPGTTESVFWLLRNQSPTRVISRVGDFLLERPKLK